MSELCFGKCDSQYNNTLPGGTAQATRTFKAPFARASSEDDYRVA